jgi:hydroxymethylbilane synthase
VVNVAEETLAPVMEELGMKEGFDVGLEMSGAEAAFNQMLDSMNHGGRIAVLGIPAGPMTLDDVPQGARVGSSSLRRRSQLLALRPDLDVVDIRGNVETRLRKLVEEDMAGTILAAAGLSRLGRSGVTGFAFSFDQMLPAVGQGALAIEARADHPRRNDLQAALDHRPTALAVSAERALLGTLEGGCQVPIAAHASWKGGEGGAGALVLDAYVGSLDGTRSVRGERERLADDPRGLGTSLAAELLDRGAGDILDEIRTP